MDYDYKTTWKDEVISAIAATIVVGGLFSAYYLALMNQLESSEARNNSQLEELCKNCAGI